MSDGFTSVYELNEPSDLTPLFDQLQATFTDTADFVCQKIGSADGGELYLCFINSLCSSEKLDYFLDYTGSGDISAQLERYNGTGLVEGHFELCEQELCNGSAVICKRSSPTGIILNLSKNQNRAIGSPIVENVLQGPMNAFNESLDVNTALIRQVVRSSRLKVWETLIGTDSITRVAVFTYAGVTDPDLLLELKDKLSKITTKGIQDSGQLLRLLMSSKRMRLFPMAVSTERPDRVVANLLIGKAVIMVNGSPFALIVPTTYFDFWRSQEDKYLNTHVTYFLLSLRILAMLVNLFLPAVYVALTSINVDVNRLEISLAAAESREGVPYPVFIETLLMLIEIGRAHV